MLKAKKNEDLVFMVIDEAEYTTTFYDFSDIPTLTEEHEALRRKKLDEVAKEFGLR